MSEETTKNFDGQEPFETRVLAELTKLSRQMTTGFAALDRRLTSLESRLDAVEQRLATLDGRVDALDGRLTSLEEKVEARLHDTRPIWEAVMARLKIIEKKMDLFAKDMLDLRAEIELLEERLPPAA